jgi:hypothetical protein
MYQGGPDLNKKAPSYVHFDQFFFGTSHFISFLIDNYDVFVRLKYQRFCPILT